MSNHTSYSQSQADAAGQVGAQHGPMAGIDAWMASHPWHPRIVPFLVYIVMLTVIGPMRDWAPISYPILYTVQCAVVAWLLWRYRRLLPELTLRFHWLALPVGAGVFAAWIVLGRWMADTWPGRFGDEGYGSFMAEQNMGPRIGWAAFVLRLVGMSVLVPLFEELFIRSLMLRSLSHGRRTAKAMLGFLQDLPLIGEWLMTTRLGERAGRRPVFFGNEFARTPLGHLTVFGVVASTFVFMLSHHSRDWPGIWVCGVAYCLLLRVTRQRGLGPVVWAHGITNAMLWGYTLYSGDWRFL